MVTDLRIGDSGLPFSGGMLVMDYTCSPVIMDQVCNDPGTGTDVVSRHDVNL